MKLFSHIKGRVWAEDVRGSGAEKDILDYERGSDSRMGLICSEGLHTSVFTPNNIRIVKPGKMG